MNRFIIIALAFLISLPVFQMNPAEGNEESGIEVSSVDVDVRIDNAYTVTEVRSTIKNTHDEAENGTFRVMIPEKAFISNFSLTLGNRTYYASVLPKEEAKQKYNESVAQGKTAGMVEEKARKLFSFSVNLKGHQTAVVALRYEEFLTKMLGRREYTLALKDVFDMAVPEFNLTIDLNSAFEITRLDRITYENTTNVEWHGVNHAVITMKRTNFLPTEDFTINYVESAPPVNGTMLTYYSPEEERFYFFNVFSPQKSALGGSIPKDIVFVLDKSGSMGSNDKDSKMSQMKKAFRSIIEQLPEEDRFTLITFNNHVDVYSNELLRADEKNRSDAAKYIDSLEAGGSTNIYDGLAKALSILKYSDERTPIIVLLTDGRPNSGKYTTSPTIRQHIRVKNTIYCPIFSLGFGDDVDFNFLSALSLENYATATKIYTGKDAGEQIRDFYETINTTLLRDIRVEYTPECDYVYPLTIPSLFEGSEVVITGICQDNGSANLTAHFTARTRYGQRDFSSSFPLDRNATNNSFIWRYWAYSRIYALLDEIKVEGESPEIVSEIVNLSMKAHFVSPYTSLYLEVDEPEPEPSQGGEKKDTPYTIQPGVPQGGRNLGVPAPANNSGEGKDASAGEPGFEAALLPAAFMLSALFYFMRKRN